MELEDLQLQLSMRTEQSPRRQGAWLVCAAEQLPDVARRVRVSPISWRSARLRRKVPSTLAGEALAKRQAVAEVEWLQIMYRDVVFGDVARTSWQNSLSPFVAVLRSSCCIRSHQPQAMVVDAKAVFDALQKEAVASRQYRRSALELAIIQQALVAAKASVKWMPHTRMPADAMTKDDITRASDALPHLLRTGCSSLIDAAEELDRRATEQGKKSRSARASREQLAESQVD